MEKLANVRAKRPRTFDPTESSGHGFLDEMSLVELRERVVLLRMRIQEEEERKRKKIQEASTNKKEVLEAMARAQAAIREQKSRAATEDRYQRRNVRDIEVSEAEQKANLEAQAIETRMTSKVENKISEALKLAKELKARKAVATMYSSAKARADELRQQDLAKGAARENATRLRKDEEKKTKAVQVHPFPSPISV
jgi:hypothetical protein